MKETAKLSSGHQWDRPPRKLCYLFVVSCSVTNWTPELPLLSTEGKGEDMRAFVKGCELRALEI